MSVEGQRKNSSNAEENSQATLFGNKNGSSDTASIRTKLLIAVVSLLAGISLVLPIVNWDRVQAKAIAPAARTKETVSKNFSSFDDQITANANHLLENGRQVF